MAELMSEVAWGNVLMMKVFKAPADCPNKTVFFYHETISTMQRTGEVLMTYWVSSKRCNVRLNPFESEKNILNTKVSADAGTIQSQEA